MPYIVQPSTVNAIIAKQNRHSLKIKQVVFTFLALYLAHAPVLWHCFATLSQFVIVLFMAHLGGNSSRGVGVHFSARFSALWDV